MTISTRMHHQRSVRRGLTIIEALTATGTITAGAAVLAMSCGAGFGPRHRFQSTFNLMTLDAAHHAYAMDHEGRQWSPAPDDMDECDGNVSCYTSQIGCIDSLLFGEDAQGNLWGWWTGGPLCDTVPGSPGYWQAVFDFAMSPYQLGDVSLTQEIVGSRVNYNTRGFRDYVSGHTYDPVFFQPGTIDSRLASGIFDESIEFPGVDHPRFPEGSQTLLATGYSISASAMWGIDVHRSASAGGWQDPRFTSGGYAAPTVDLCLHPDLKTRMIERWWIDGAPSRIHPATRAPVNGDVQMVRPGQHWMFNHAHEARPVALFFDGSIQAVRTGDAFDDDLAQQRATGDGLWSRDTPFGTEGQQGSISRDRPTSFHVLTTDGIRGRDFLSRRDG